MSAAPPGVRVMSVVRWVLVALSVLAAGWSWTSYVRAHDHGTDGGARRQEQLYRCPMHPQVISSTRGECPICHMDLVPFADEPVSGAPSTDAGAAAAALPPGAVPVTLSFDRVQSIGVRTSVVTERDLGASLRVTAVVAAPEQTASEVHVRTSGFVEQISVNETGIRVGAGQTLLSLYSPEVYQAETELVTAMGFGDLGAPSVVASRKRLELLGVPQATIERVVADKAPVRVFPVTAPAAGFIAKKSVVLGSYVTPDAKLYELVDLSRVYAIADVLPGDAAELKVGIPGKLTIGERTWDTKVDLVYPELDPQARTTRVRMQLRNDKQELRPGQYGTVELARPARRALVVPRDAVIDTGKVPYVFVDGGEGLYTPRIVTLGKPVDDLIELTRGVANGERVVSGATFLIDSESRLRASFASAASSAQKP